MSEEFVLKDSKELQMKSLKEFMHGFGYIYDEGTFRYYRMRYTDKEAISFITAVMLHNGTLPIDWHGKRYKEPFDNFTFYQINKARAAKIVDRVHLQWSKKEKRVIVTQHLVKFVYEEYYHLFWRMLK